MSTVPSLFELAENALQRAFILRCEYLLSQIHEMTPSPFEQNGCLCKVKRQKYVH